jgi:hypothetical protein
MTNEELDSAVRILVEAGEKNEARRVFETRPAVDADTIAYTWPRYVQWSVASDPAAWDSISFDGAAEQSAAEIRAEAAAAERARIMAALETCRPTETQYTRRDWAIEEKGKRELWDKIMKAIDSHLAGDEATAAPEKGPL